MSVHVEWMLNPTVTFVPAGSDMPDGQLTDTDALILECDEVVVVEGDLDAFLEAVRQAVQNPTGEGWRL